MYDKPLVPRSSLGEAAGNLADSSGTRVRGMNKFLMSTSPPAWVLTLRSEWARVTTVRNSAVDNAELCGHDNCVSGYTPAKVSTW